MRQLFESYESDYTRTERKRDRYRRYHCASVRIFNCLVEKYWILTWKRISSLTTGRVHARTFDRRVAPSDSVIIFRRAGAGEGLISPASRIQTNCSPLSPSLALSYRHLSLFLPCRPFDLLPSASPAFSEILGAHLCATLCPTSLFTRRSPSQQSGKRCEPTPLAEISR